MLAIRAIEAMESWIRDVKLQLAHHKTEMVLVTNCKKIEKSEIAVGEHSISSARQLKYLRVMIDDRLNYNSHVDYACSKAAEAYWLASPPPY